MERRLAAILAADVVGYSRRMGESETATLKALRECRAVLGDLVVAEKGRIINTAGDSVLAEFQSVIGAVRCATTFQSRMDDRNSYCEPIDRLEFRVGINQGELVADDADVYGDGINVAVRLEGIAPPGGLAVSARVYEDVLGKLDVEWIDGGERDLKNIVRPVHVWLNGNAQPVLAKHASPAPSVAVLPFTNVGGDASEDFFCDGITENIIFGLSRFRSLLVIARSSSFAFRDSGEQISAIAAKLGVNYLIEGTVRRSDDRIRVTVELTRPLEGVSIWADRYDRVLSDVFEVQDEISMRIVGSLVGRIEDAQTKLTFRKPPSNLVAFDLHLRGLSRFRDYDAKANEEAMEFFRSAIAADPGYALPYSFLALAMLASHDYSGAPKEIRAQAVELARTGVGLSPQDATCQRLMGHVLLQDRDYDLAEHHARRALELNPHDADCVISMGYLLVQRGRPEEGLAHMEQAVRLNPFHPPWYHAQIAGAFYSLRRYEDCIRSGRKLPDPQAVWSFRLAAAYAQLRRTREASLEAAKVLEHDPAFRVDTFLERTILLEKDEDRRSLRAGLLRAGLPN